MLRTDRKFVSEYSPLEELLNTLSHALGLGLSITGTVFIIIQASYTDAWSIVGASIFGSTLILLYLASTLYHGLSLPIIRGRLRKSLFGRPHRYIRWKISLLIFDYCAIYLLIAGSYTAFILSGLRTKLGWTIFGITWGLALLGIIYKLFFLRKSGLFADILYLVMGWLMIAAVHQFIAVFPMASIALAFAGGFSYTIGFVFFSWEKIPLNHFIFHVMVLIGSACHYFAAYYHIALLQS